MGIKYFCVSDIHSFYQPLLSALTDKGFDINDKDHKLIICGDAFDRGDDTIKVFEFMKKLSSEDRLIYIMGNHEELLIQCLDDLINTRETPGNHHFHNGTIKTICTLCGQNEWIAYGPRPDDIRQMIREKTQEICDFISTNCIDYFKLGNKIFVHSWLPLKAESEIYSLWDVDPNTLDDVERKNLQYRWNTARWGNPFLNWKNGLFLKDKCIVFGHFHTSYGHSRIDMKCKEWPQKNKSNWEDAFKPWVKENAIGIDSCVAYSGKINCIVFDDKGNILDY